MTQRSAGGTTVRNKKRAGRVGRKIAAVIGIALAALLALGGAGLAVAAGGQQEVDVYWYIDDTQASVYYITDAQELRGLAELVNGTAVNPDTGQAIPAVDFSGKTIKQTHDLVCCFPGSEQALTPIGTAEHPFNGTYDGQGHSIRGITFDNTATYVGLFGCTGADSLLKGISLTTSSLYPSAVTLSSDTQVMQYIGSLVGYAGGDVEDCTSRVPVTIESTMVATEANPIPVKSVGGLIGFCAGDVTGSSNKGALKVSVASDSVLSNLSVALGVGGVVGKLGLPDNHGVMRSCFNTGNVWVVTTGAGEYDRFGVVTYARSMGVGGVVGYTNGSIYDSYNGTYDSLFGVGTGTVQTSSTVSVDGAPVDARGGDEVGGVVGSVRGESEAEGRYNDGDPNDPTYVQNCHNVGTVVGCCATGGIAGQCGVYCYITQCYNGYAEDESVGHVVTTRWNKPSTGGILGQGRGATVTYCANYALIENVQTGYYTAGVVGSLYYSDDYPDFQTSVYACFNSGHIFTANRDEEVEYREAGLVGVNEGYVHDCVMLYGTVPYHEDAPIGAADWGMTGNLHVLTQSEMETSYCAALLNACNNGSWDVYWYMNYSGLPVLNVWEDPVQVTELTPDIIESVEVAADAGYIGPGIEPIPELVITIEGGRRLWQNTDFYVVPQPGAYEITREGERPYSASIVGLGQFTGRVDNVANYGIGKGDLSDATVLTSNGKYSLGHTTFPVTIMVLMGGAEVESSSYSYRIYDYATTSLTGRGKHYVVFDSEGFISYDGGSTLEPVPLGQALDTGDYILYDRTGRKISDSDAAVYDPDTGAVVAGGRSCAFYRSGTPAGYIVEVSARTSAVKFSGSALGRFVVSTASFKDDVVVESIQLGDQTWYWDSASGTMYALDDQGNPVVGNPKTTFTGLELEPKFTMTYMGHELVEDQDFLYVYGDENTEDGWLGPNIGVTSDDKRGVVTIRSADTSRFSNYLMGFFDILPARLEDCEIGLPATDYAFTGYELEPEVSVVLDGVKLVEDRDYTVEYADNVRSGTATYTVTALDNLSGGEQQTFTGTFQIGRGIDISTTLTLDEIEPTYYNFGLTPKIDIVLRDATTGEPVELVEGADYTVELSSLSVGNCHVTVKGIGPYTGQLACDTVILPYDVVTNPYNQVRVEADDLVYGSWYPDYGMVSGRYNVSSSCPVRSVEFWPVVDWSTDPVTYADTCYNSRSSQEKVGTLDVTHTDADGNSVTWRTAQPGPLTATVTFGLYTSSGYRYGCSGTLSFDVDYYIPVDVATDVVWTTTETVYYTGEAQTPIVGTTGGSGAALTEGTDYTIEYENNTNVGVARYTVTGAEDSHYTGTYTGSFAILPVDLTTKATVKKIPSQTWTGQPLVPEPIVRVNGRQLVKDTDYTLAYMFNTDPGKGLIYITGKGNYGGRTSVQFDIVDEGGYTDLSDGQVQGLESLYRYSGSAIDPVFDVVLSGELLERDVDYTVTIVDSATSEVTDPVEPGDYLVVIEGTGAYTGGFTVGFSIVANGQVWERLAGNDAFYTMQAVVDEAFDHADTVVIATNSGYWDALAASSVAGAYNAPVLMTKKSTLSPVTRSEIERLQPTRAFVCGGPSAVSDDVVAQIEEMGVSVTRLAGSTAPGTAVEIAKQVGTAASDTCIIASSDTFQDALSISPYAYATRSPIFLTSSKGAKLSDLTMSAIAQGGYRHAVIVGGNAVVKDPIEQQLRSLNLDVTRLWGNTCYETSAAIAAWELEQGLTTNNMAVASGKSYYDALSGSALCGQRGSILVLVDDRNRSCINNTVAPNASSITRGYILGGPAAVSQATQDQLEFAMGG